MVTHPEKEAAVSTSSYRTALAQILVAGADDAARALCDKLENVVLPLYSGDGRDPGP